MRLCQCCLPEWGRIRTKVDVEFLTNFDSDRRSVRGVLEALGKAGITHDCWKKFLCTAKSDKLPSKEATENMRGSEAVKD